MRLPDQQEPLFVLDRAPSGDVPFAACLLPGCPRVVTFALRGRPRLFCRGEHRKRYSQRKASLQKQIQGIKTQLESAAAGPNSGEARELERRLAVLRWHQLRYTHVLRSAERPSGDRLGVARPGSARDG